MAPKTAAKPNDRTQGPGGWAGRQAGGLDDTRLPTGEQAGHGGPKGGLTHEAVEPAPEQPEKRTPRSPPKDEKNPIDIES